MTVFSLPVSLMELPLPHRVAITRPQPCRALGSCLLMLATSPAEVPVRASSQVSVAVPWGPSSWPCAPQAGSVPTHPPVVTCASLT